MDARCAPPAVGYRQLRAWIDAQEQYEREHGQPAPLTAAQRQAMALFVPPTAELPSPDAAREVNWIGLVMQYDQAQVRYHDDHVSFDQEPVLVPGGRPMLWRYRCRLPAEAPGQLFPDATDDSVFVKKKDAKKYAAYCAVRWLMVHHYMPTDGTSVTFKRTAPLTSPAAAACAPPPPALYALPASADDEAQPSLDDFRQRLAAPLATPPTTSRVASMASWPKSSDTAAPAAPTAPPNPTTPPSARRRRRSSGADASSAQQQLKALCQELGLGTPEYCLTPCPGMEAAFDGQLTLASPKRRQVMAATAAAAAAAASGPSTPAQTTAAPAATVVLPSDVGVVSEVYTREATREKMARSALTYLLDRYGTRAV